MSAIIPINLNAKHQITKETKFIINDIICAGFSKVNDNTISILFGLHQDLFDKYQYFNINVLVENDKELDMFMDSNMFINDLKKDKENADRLKEICSYLTPSNLFTVDLTFTYKDGDRKNHIMKGVRNTGKDNIEIQEYLINDSCYIQLSLFKEFIKKSLISNVIFFDNALKRVSTITPAHCKLDGSIIKEITNKAGKYYQVISHYRFQYGATSLRVNYRVNIPTLNKKLREPLTIKQYEAEFSKDLYVRCTLYEENTDEVLLIIVNENENKTTIVRLKEDLYNHTNFKDMYNYVFYDIETSDSNIEVPHLLFKF